MALIHFIVNTRRPSIGMRWPYEEQKVRNLTNDFRVHITRGRSHAELLTREAIEAGAKLIVCVGGDSTLCEIANELYRAERGGLSTPSLTVYNGLQQGDAVKSMQLNRDFLETLADFLKGSGIHTKLDVGEVEFTGDFGQRVRRLFVNAAGFGFSSLVVDRLSRDPKASRSRFGFFRLVMRLAPFYRYPEIDLVIDGKKRLSQTPVLTGLIHNGRYGGRGIRLSPDATLSDGKLEFTLFKKTFTLRYLGILLKLLSGNLGSSPVVVRDSFKELQVSPSYPHRRVQVDFDGDVWGYLPATFRIIEQAIDFIS